MIKLAGGLPVRIDALSDADERLQATHTACLSLPGAEFLNPHVLEQHN
jgi:hypothetical protein